MAHKKPTEHTVKVNGEPCVIIWRTGYRVEQFAPGKEVIYRKAHEEGGRVIWRIGAVRGRDKKGILHLKYLGIKPKAIPIKSGRWSDGKRQTNMQELPENAWGVSMFSCERSICS